MILGCRREKVRGRGRIKIERGVGDEKWFDTDIFARKLTMDVDATSVSGRASRMIGTGK